MSSVFTGNARFSVFRCLMRLVRCVLLLLIHVFMLQVLIKIQVCPVPSNGIQLHNPRTKICVVLNHLKPVFVKFMG